jgi:hypothetical protein
MKKLPRRHAAAAALVVIATGLFAAQESTLKPIQYTSEGGLAVPDYSKWVFIGSGLSNSGQASQNPRFSNIFAEPAAWDQYMKKGVWPDRTMIFSEKRAAISTLSVTTNGGWGQTGNTLGAELEVKDDSKGGWVFYEVAAGEKVGKPVARTGVCYGCHAQHGAVDNTFVQFYPSLVEAAKRNGTWKDDKK